MAAEAPKNKAAQAPSKTKTKDTEGEVFELAPRFGGKNYKTSDKAEADRRVRTQGYRLVTKKED